MNSTPANRIEPRLLVAICTYNEIENLPLLIEQIEQLMPNADLLVVDDGSPDGTGDWCRARMKVDSRLKLIERDGKLGLGSATVRAFQYVIEKTYDLVVTLDADFSHPPERMSELVAKAEQFDVVIGSRYVEGGAIKGWPVPRRMMSWLVNGFARRALRIPAYDLSGAYRCYRVEALRRLDVQTITSTGYAYLEEILWKMHRLGCTVAEVPITFVDRKRGKSKISIREARNACWSILAWSWQERFGGSPPSQ
jgi:dolichol-phosphate mannosyltransferase